GVIAKILVLKGGSFRISRYSEGGDYWCCIMEERLIVLKSINHRKFGFETSPFRATLYEWVDTFNKDSLECEHGKSI
ncbi:MAG: hypothetical protein ACKO5Q_00275, partial [Microcystaceae cyanobacterium]